MSVPAYEFKDWLVDNDMASSDVEKVSDEYFVQSGRDGDDLAVRVFTPESGGFELLAERTWDRSERHTGSERFSELADSVSEVESFVSENRV